MPCVAGAALTRLVPESTSDCVAFDAPALEILPDGARIDGTRLVGSEDLRDILSASAGSGSRSTRGKCSQALSFWSFDPRLPHGSCCPG